MMLFITSLVGTLVGFWVGVLFTRKRLKPKDRNYGEAEELIKEAIGADSVTQWGPPIYATLIQCERQGYETISQLVPEADLINPDKPMLRRIAKQAFQNGWTPWEGEAETSDCPWGVKVKR